MEACRLIYRRVPWGVLCTRHTILWSVRITMWSRALSLSHSTSIPLFLFSFICAPCSDLLCTKSLFRQEVWQRIQRSVSRLANTYTCCSRLSTDSYLSFSFILPVYAIIAAPVCLDLYSVYVARLKRKSNGTRDSGSPTLKTQREARAWRTPAILRPRELTTPLFRNTYPVS